MQNRTCSKCGSTNVYKNLGESWHQDGIIIQTVTEESFNDLFQTDAFLCLDCRNLEIQVSAFSNLYGKQKKLSETIQASKNWIKA